MYLEDISAFEVSSLHFVRKVGHVVTGLPKIDISSLLTEQLVIPFGCHFSASKW